MNEHDNFKKLEQFNSKQNQTNMYGNIAIPL